MFKMNKKLLTVAVLIFLSWVAFIGYEIYKVRQEDKNTYNNEAPNMLTPKNQSKDIPDELTPEESTVSQPSEDTASYTCPKSGYIDCMPRIGDQSSNACDSKYVDWAKANCPDFQGVAY